MTDRAWFDAAKGDIPQWAASMPKDAWRQLMPTMKVIGATLVLR